MKFEIHISDLAESDIESAYCWWRDNRSAEQAARWFHQIHKAVQALESMPFRCPQCDETELGNAEIRQLFFGIGRRPTHRIIFEISENEVNILRVRHAAQNTLATDDLD